MRVVAIRGQNLASLARSFAVELDRGELGEAGLFAITGPVGAGKSTLLDAMCLALFDRTPRLVGRGGPAIGEPQQDRGDWLRAYDVRTLLRREALDGFAEVDFIGRDGVRYRARWSVRRAYRKADGRLQEQEMALTDLDRGVVVAGGRRTEVLAAIQLRLGLDFEQFCRSVLLAQGEFHKFLHSGADERAKLLETLTGASIYRRLSKAAHERRRDGERRVEKLRGQFEQCRVLDEAARAALEQRIRQLDVQLEVCRIAIEKAQEYVNYHSTAEELQRMESLATGELRRAQAAEQAARFRGERLQRLVRAAALAPHLRLVTEARDESEALARQLAAVQRELVRTRAVADERGRELTRLFAAAFAGACAPEPLLESLPEPLPEIVAELPRWRVALERWREAEVEAERAVVGLPAQVAALAAAEEQCATMQHDGERLAAARGEAAAARAEAERRAEAFAPESLAARRQQLRERHLQWTSLASACAIAERALHRHGEAAQRITALRVRGEELLRQQEESVAKANRLDEELAAARERLRIAERHHGLAALRAELEDGIPCPLCGAHEHPAAASPVPDLAVLQRALAARQRAADEGRQRAAVARATAQQLAEDTLRADREFAAAQRDVAAAFATWASPDTAAPVDPEVRLVAARTQAVDAEAAWRHDDRELGEAERDAAAATTLLRRAFGELERCDAALRAHQVQREAAERARDTARRALVELQRDAERLQQVLAERERALEPACAALPGGAASLAPLGPRRWTTLQAMHTVHADLVILRARTADAERQVAACAARAELAHETASRAQEAFAAATAAAQVDGDEVAEAVGLGPAALAAEEQELRGLAEDVLRCRSVLQERVARRRQHEHHDRPTLDAADARRALEDARRSQQEVSKGRDDVQRQLGSDDTVRRQRDELAPRLATAERELDVWRALDDLIGSSHGDAFAVFAQELTLDLLLLEANRRLAELARRYRLERIPGGELDFLVVDLDLGGARRGLRTLSGGETFLVSLALALALATLSADRSRVETLFLDEGFGTLDAQSLEVALAALDSLQATGCQVGIISHVDGIAERIGVVVEVQPEGSGRSRVVVGAR